MPSFYRGEFLGEDLHSLCEVSSDGHNFGFGVLLCLQVIFFHFFALDKWTILSLDAPPSPISRSSIFFHIEAKLAFFAI